MEVAKKAMDYDKYPLNVRVSLLHVVSPAILRIFITSMPAKNLSENVLEFNLKDEKMHIACRFTQTHAYERKAST